MFITSSYTFYRLVDMDGGHQIDKVEQLSDITGDIISEYIEAKQV